MSVCLSVRMEQLGSYWKDFHENVIFEDFLKICRENSSFIKTGQEKTDTLHGDLCTFVIISR
jgi:hypothetical protein